MIKSVFTAALLATGLALTLPAAALAKGETPPSTKKCKAGKVYDKASKNCVDAHSNLIIDDERYTAVREYAYFGDYDNALKILASFDDQNDPRRYNYYGFVNRKQGHMKEAMAFYAQALDIDPDYVLARSYMGQGLVSQGDMDGAATQLREIETRSGRDTWAYKALAMAMAGAPTDY